MINFFNKENNQFDNKRPDFYDGLVSQEEYEIILGLCITTVQNFGEVTSVANGTITITDPEDADQEFQFHLDNLVRKCKGLEVSDWEKIIEDHFSKFPTNRSKEKYILKDFDYARDLLRISVRAKEILPEEDIPAFISRIDIPDTYTFLILEYDEKFHFVRFDEIGEWEKTPEELFEIAIQNVAQQEVEVKEYLWDDQYETYVFFSGDFSASYMVELEKNAPYAVGELGAIVTIPTKGTAIVHPLEGDSGLDFISAIGETQQEFYNEDEVPISDNFYWYYQGEYTIFPERMEEGNVMISYPEKLAALLDENEES